jgi:exonuclease 1
MTMLNLLAKHNITPIMVFDGEPLPSKSICNNKRHKLRTHNKALARSASEMGDTTLASTLYQRAISVTKEMINDLINALIDVNIQYIVAPYEADAQLAYLSRNKLVDIIITEDSDCIVYGCRSILYKLDREGYGDMIHRSDLGSNEGLTFTHWKDEQFKLFCTLAGCDYVTKIKGLGIKTAHRIVCRGKTYSMVLSILRDEYKIDDEYALEVS